MSPVPVPVPITPASKGKDARLAWRLNTSALLKANERLSASARWYESVRETYRTGR